MPSRAYLLPVAGGRESVWFGSASREPPGAGLRKICTRMSKGIFNRMFIVGYHYCEMSGMDKRILRVNFADSERGVINYLMPN